MNLDVLCFEETRSSLEAAAEDLREAKRLRKEEQQQTQIHIHIQEAVAETFKELL